METEQKIPTVRQLLQAVADRGVEIYATRPDRLFFGGALPDRLVAELQAQARDVVDYLLAGPGASEAPPSPSPERTSPPPPRPSEPGRRDLRAELEEEDGDYPDAWRPEIGEILVGELVRYSRGHTTYGEAVIAIVSHEGTGELAAVWLLHHVLLDEFRKLRPSPGERIGIKRLPDAERAQNPYQRFIVRVDRPDEVPDALGPDPRSQETQDPRESSPPGGRRPSPAPAAPPIAGPDDDLPF